MQDFRNKSQDFKSDIQLPPELSPKGSISSISWAHKHPIFATTSWDGQLRVYEVKNIIELRISLHQHLPLVNCCWNLDDKVLFYGNSQGLIMAMEIKSKQAVGIGVHTAGINSLHIAPNEILVSSGYDKFIHLWKLASKSLIYTIDLKYKILKSAFSYPILVAGMGQQKIAIVNIQQPQKPSILESTELGYHSQIQTIAINNDHTVLAIGSIDGRTNISRIRYINNQYSIMSLITFKSNKRQEKGKIILYPVNVVLFHNYHSNWIMTAGSNGSIDFWDYQQKNKIKSFYFNGTPICAASLTPNGQYLAYALGNDWHIGQEGNKWDTLLAVHIIKPNQLKIK